MQETDVKKVEHILEQGSGARNEDFLIMGHDIFGVFDGATSLTDACYKEGKSGGCMASVIAGQVFLRNHLCLAKLGSEANESIRTQMEQCQVDLSQRCCLWSTTVTVVRLRNGEIE